MMNTSAPRVRYIHVFFTMEFLLAVVFDVLLLRALGQTDAFAFYSWLKEHDPHAALWLSLWMLTPLFVLLLALYFLFVELRKATHPAWLTPRNVVIFVAVIFAFNLLVRQFLPPPDQAFGTPLSVLIQRAARSVAMSPSFLAADAVFVGFNLWCVFRVKEVWANELERVAVLGMSLGNSGAHILAFLYEL